MMPASRKANNHIIYTYLRNCCFHNMITRLQVGISTLIRRALIVYKTATENAKKYST